MNTVSLVVLIVVFLLTAVVSVVTGGTSLITVPVMMQLDIDPHVAVATNMVALIFLSLGGTLPFLKGRMIPRGRLPGLIGLTLVASALGARLLVVVPSHIMPLVVSGAMIAVASFSLLHRNAGVSEAPGQPSPTAEVAGYVLTFLLGVYGGFFSGGYVALLTAAYVAAFRMTFLEAVAVTKVLNLVSSLVATILFAWTGLIDWHLGLLLGAVSFVGAGIGSTLARRMSNDRLRRIFLAAVIALAALTLLRHVAGTVP